MPDEIAAIGASGDEEAIEEFRRLVKERLGDLSLAVLDLRLAGGDTKSLVNSPKYGSPSSYRIKQVVQAIKGLAQEFGDEEFKSGVEKAMAGEQKTMNKRFGARVVA